MKIGFYAARFACPSCLMFSARIVDEQDTREDEVKLWCSLGCGFTGWAKVEALGLLIRTRPRRDPYFEKLQARHLPSLEEIANEASENDFLDSHTSEARLCACPYGIMNNPYTDCDQDETPEQFRERINAFFEARRLAFNYMQDVEFGKMYTPAGETDEIRMTVSNQSDASALITASAEVRGRSRSMRTSKADIANHPYWRDWKEQLAKHARQNLDEIAMKAPEYLESRGYRTGSSGGLAELVKAQRNK